jgi:hypothetical protein
MKNWIKKHQYSRVSTYGKSMRLGQVLSAFNDETLANFIKQSTQQRGKECVWEEKNKERGSKSKPEFYLVS